MVWDYLNAKRYGLKCCLPNHKIDLMRHYFNYLNCFDFQLDLDDCRKCESMAEMFECEDSLWAGLAQPNENDENLDILH